MAVGATQRLGEERLGVSAVQHARSDQGESRVAAGVCGVEPAKNGIANAGMPRPRLAKCLPRGECVPHRATINAHPWPYRLPATRRVDNDPAITDNNSSAAQTPRRPTEQASPAGVATAPDAAVPHYEGGGASRISPRLDHGCEWHQELRDVQQCCPACGAL
jgi:hypothetical protein